MKYVTLEEVCENRTSNISQKDLKGNEGIYPIYGASGLIKKVDFYIQDKEYIGIVKDGAGVGRTMLLPSKSSVIGTMQYIIPNGILNIKYLYYALISKKLSKYSSGATIPHIYFRDYKKEKILLISEIEQQKIVSILDNIVSLIEKNKKRIILLEELVKSRFIEMFGDPIRNDKGWEITFMNKISIKRGEYGSNKSSTVYDGGYRYIRITDIKENGTLKEEKVGVMDEEIEVQKYKLEEGDILFARSGATVGKTFLYRKKYGNCIFAGYLIRFKLNLNRVNPYYIKHYTDTEYYKKWIKNYQNIVAQPNINAKQYGEELKVLLPPLSLQNEFAEFVTKTNKLKFRLFSSIILGKNLFKNLTLLIFLDNIRLVLELDKKNKNKKLNMGVKKDV